MKFINQRKTQLSLLDGWINYSKSEFEIIANKYSTPKKIIDNFIKNEQDFLTAKKLKDGLVWNYKDENGIEKKYKIKIFGLYEKDKLAFEDYKEVDFQTFNKEFLKMIMDLENKKIKNQTFEKKIKLIKSSINSLDKENSDHFLLKPSKEKISELNPFNDKNYLCGFSIDLATKKINVIQIDDD